MRGTSINAEQAVKKIEEDASDIDKNGNPKRPFIYKGEFYGLINGIKVYDDSVKPDDNESLDSAFEDEEDTGDLPF